MNRYDRIQLYRQFIAHFVTLNQRVRQTREAMKDLAFVSERSAYKVQDYTKELDEQEAPLQDM